MSNVSTLKKGGSTGTGGNNYAPVIVHHEIDIAAAVAAGLATTEYVVVATIPANTYFRMLQIECVDSIVLGSGARVDVGDATTATQFVSNATTLTAGTDLTLANSIGATEVYPAASELRLKLTGASLASTTGKIRFCWLQGDTSRLAKMTTQS